MRRQRGEELLLLLCDEDGTWRSAAHGEIDRLKAHGVQFRNDVYAQDEQLLEATAEEAAFFNQAANHPLTAHMAR